VSKFRKPKAYRKVRHENCEVREEKIEIKTPPAGAIGPKTKRPPGNRAASSSRENSSNGGKGKNSVKTFLVKIL
jgi:hypothetical protein